MGRGRSAVGCAIASLLTLVASGRAMGGEPQRSEPEALVETAQAWYAALDAGDAARMQSFYADTGTGDRGRQDVERFRGVPIEFGAQTRSEAGDVAWLQIHAGNGTWHLSTWRHSSTGWKLAGIDDLAPELFLTGPAYPPPGGWPSEHARTDSPACVVYRLVRRLQWDMPSSKELETDYFRPSEAGDRSGYGEFLESAASVRTIPDVVSLSMTGDKGVRTALGVIRVRDEFRARFVEAASGWRIVTVALVTETPAEPPMAVRSALLVVARSALAAIGTRDAAAFARVAVDLSSASVRPMPLERARARVAVLSEQFGRRFSASDEGARWSRGQRRVTVQADAPDMAGDWKKVYLKMVGVGDAWWVLDVNDGFETQVVTQAEIVPK